MRNRANRRILRKYGEELIAKVQHFKTAFPDAEPEAIAFIYSPAIRTVDAAKAILRVAENTNV